MEEFLQNRYTDFSVLYLSHWNISSPVPSHRFTWWALWWNCIDQNKTAVVALAIGPEEVPSRYIFARFLAGRLWRGKIKHESQNPNQSWVMWNECYKARHKGKILFFNDTSCIRNIHPNIFMKRAQKTPRVRTRDLNPQYLNNFFTRFVLWVWEVYWAKHRLIFINTLNTCLQ